ncbi:TspO/MBR family protein [Shimia abyssi]|uniref:TspO/MBR related protein n=1 Tax=Shimia abyssi TaxID=1662395 RepID=A0A2P8FD09_9RHOB|nr:TspO/MBR family protein [Shimia abyssi]PSL19597.1 TspO/MBR related protein [Shimia abyssi]
MSVWVVRLAFLVLVMGGGILIGTTTAPGSWYADLNKPFFNPPNWIFGPVWTVLYVLIAMVGWRQFEGRRSGAETGAVMRLWWAQLGLNFLWSPAFFVMKLPWLALIVIGALWVVLVFLIRSTARTDQVSTWALLPYLAWVSFALLLNLSIAVLN